MIVWFHRARAIFWIAAGVAAFLFGWQESVTFILIASVYANVVGDLGAAEAADDRQVLERLEQLEEMIKDLQPPAQRDTALDSYVERSVGFEINHPSDRYQTE